MHRLLEERLMGVELGMLSGLRQVLRAFVVEVLGLV